MNHENKIRTQELISSSYSGCEDNIFLVLYNLCVSANSPASWPGKKQYLRPLLGSANSQQVDGEARRDIIITLIYKLLARTC